MDDAGPRLRLGVVPGVAVGRWADTWRARYREIPLELRPVAAADAARALLAAELDAAFLRLPLPPSALARIPLWTEESVVALSRENELTLLDALTPRDLETQTVIVAADDVLGWSAAPGEPFAGRQPPTSADALDLVAQEAGVCVLPKAIARESRRRDVELRPLIAAGDDDAADIPVSQVALAWLPRETGEAPDVVEDFIGIVRGRTVNSTRGNAARRPVRAARSRRSQSR